jgi:TonB family protein
MNILLIYMVKVAVYLTAFYLVYSLMLSRDTAYGRNRAFILISLVSAIVFPLFTFETVKPMDIQFFGKFLSEVFITASPERFGNASSGFSIPGTIQIMYTIYIIGVVAILFKLIIDLFNLVFLILRERSSGSRIIRFHGFNTAGFSAMGYIFLNTRLNPEEAGEIIRHEQNHLKQNHFLDIIFMETVLAFQWFNPVIYMINRDLRAVHEFQADHECIISGVPVVSYQSLLLSQVFKSRAFNLTNSFSNPSLIKRRMIMMTKKPTSALANMKLLLVLPVIAIVFLAISAYKEIPDNNILQQTERESFVLTSSIPVSEVLSTQVSEPDKATNKPSGETETPKITKQSSIQDNIAPPPPPPPPPVDKQNVVEETITENVETAEVPFVVVEEMPMFPGGDVSLLKFLGENTNYPQAAKEANLQGRVIVRFCVTAKGGVSQATILKGVSPELDEEALRVVSTLPAFEPGKQGGRPVPVWYMVPITFTLR